MVGMLISSTNRDSHGDFLVWGFKNGEFFPVGMEEKVSQKEV
jgi:hypothetical protein